MGKLFLFILIWRLTGSPILAIIVVLVILYFIDRRYIGLLPSILKPFRRLMRISNLRKQLDQNPHDMPAKFNLAQAYIERKQYQKAYEHLTHLSPTMQESADVLYHIGLCQLSLGRVDEGEGTVLQSLTQDHRLRYGEPYLKLAAAVATKNPTKALDYIKTFQSLNVSSCESYYRMALLYKQFGDTQAAKAACKDCLDTYRMLPKFRKRVERRWALLARLRIGL